MNAQLKAELGNARQCLLETYQLAIAFGDTDTQDVEKYFDLGGQLSHINESSKRHEDALECAKVSRTLDDFEAEYAKAIKNLENKKRAPKKSSEYQEFKGQLLLLKQVVDDAQTASSSGGATRVEDDDFVMEGSINVLDPLTKQRMRKPVQNTICKHHYEKASILEAIDINKRLRCPVAGCGNKQFVTRQHLQDDNVFKARLEQMQEQDGDEDED